MKFFSSKDSNKQFNLSLGIASIGGLLYIGYKHYKRSLIKNSKKAGASTTRTITNEKIEELNENNFPDIINKYAEAFLDSKVLEWILPREIDEKDFARLSDNSPYSEGQHDFYAMKKVRKSLFF